MKYIISFFSLLIILHSFILRTVDVKVYEDVVILGKGTAVVDHSGLIGNYLLQENQGPESLPKKNNDIRISFKLPDFVLQNTTFFAKTPHSFFFPLSLFTLPVGKLFIVILNLRL